MWNWDLIQNYFENNQYYLTKHQVDSYNDFVSNKIPQAIANVNEFEIIKNKGDTVFHNIVVHIGGKTHDELTVKRPANTKGEIEYPNECRLKNLDYLLEVKANVTVTYKQKGLDDTDVEFKDVLLGKIPLMLHSQHCPLNGRNAPTLEQMGECIYDQGGYFIVAGKEKVIVAQERMITNRLFVEPEPEPYTHKAIVRCTDPENIFPKTVRFFVHDETSCRGKRKNAIVCTVETLKNPVTKEKMVIPVFVLFRALGIESDYDIIQLIDSKESEDFLRASVLDGNFVHTQESALKYLTTFVEYQNRDNLEYVLKDDVFPNMGEHYHDKANYLGSLVKELLGVVLYGNRAANKDHYAYKRVDISGYLLSNLFRDFYNELRNNIESTIDNQYNLLSVETHEELVRLVNESNFRRIFDPSIITTGFLKSMKGSWGRTADAPEGIVQDLNRLSYMGYVSHVRRVNTPMDRSLKIIEPHKLHASQWGFMCPFESPDGINVGLIKHMSVMCQITSDMPTAPVIELAESLGMKNYQTGKTKVFVNGTLQGCHDTPHELVQGVREARRSGAIHKHTGIAWKIIKGEIYIHTDAGRCVRPLVVADASANEIPDFEKLLQNGTVEFVDVEESNDLYIAMSKEDANERHTHIEIHPSMTLSMYTNTIPFVNHNQAPRVIFSGQQGKQAVGVYATNFNNRIETASYILHYPQKPLLETRMLEYANGQHLPNGENVIVAIATYTGYNQEDAVILNRDSVQRGMFNTTYFKGVSDSESSNPQQGVKTRFANPRIMQESGQNIKLKLKKWTTPKGEERLDADGLPMLNVKVGRDEVLLGKIGITATQRAPPKSVEDLLSKKDVQYEYKDLSICGDLATKGKVDKVYTYIDEEDHMHVKIRLRTMRLPQLGDKFASRHGQKGITGMILPAAEMPFSKDGLVPDMIINPHAIPTRQTIGHLLECMIANLSCETGTNVDSTAFEKHDVDSYAETMTKLGMSSHGDESLRNGRTGELMDTKIFIGPTYYYRLKHMVEDKINHRDTGAVSMNSMQPVRGRALGGAQRVGEMESWSIMAHGMASFIKETFVDRSDGYDFAIDDTNKAVCAWNIARDEFKSTANPDELDFHRIHAPYAYKQMAQELESVGIRMRLHTERKEYEEYQDGDLNYGLEDEEDQ